MKAQKKALWALAAVIIGLMGCSNPESGETGGQKPELQGMVVIDGTAKVGETLTANIGGVTNGTGTALYQWKRGGAAIDGATGGTYKVLEADAEKSITVTVTFSGSTGSLPSAPVTIAAIIPSYTRHSYNKVRDINFDDISVGSLPLVLLPQYTNNNDGNILQGHVLGKWFDLLCQMQVQGDNLKNGYSAVAEAYPDLAGIDGIIANENGIHGKIDNTRYIDTYLSGADANINAMLNGILGSGDRTQFNKNLAAYKLGHYANQKVLDGKAAAQAEYADALAATGLADLSALESAMLNAINGAMGVNDIKKASHRGVVSGLNVDLIKQIQDLEQAKALTNDLDGLNYVNVIGDGMTFSQAQGFKGNAYNESRDAQTVQLE